jgi:hypothetical protein
MWTKRKIKPGRKLWNNFFSNKKIIENIKLKRIFTEEMGKVDWWLWLVKSKAKGAIRRMRNHSFIRDFEKLENIILECIVKKSIILKSISE